jgi:hypothetical protein
MEISFLDPLSLLTELFSSPGIMCYGGTLGDSLLELNLADSTYSLLLLLITSIV